ncbi:MAG: hypothetical protein MUO99_07390 [Dehalococcoidales bacterium]|nr:hypothetical protein [Dehalococcoidales bacterium]
MMQQQGIVKGDVLQKIGSAGFIIGAILLVIFSVLGPRVSDPSKTQEVLQKLGDQEVLAQVCALLLAVGFWAVMVGAAGIYRSISAGAGAVWARLGFYGILVGAAMWSITYALNMATAGAAANAATALAAGQATAYTTAYSVAAALYAGALSVETMSIIETWLALVFLGIGMVLSAVYPRWMGWVGIVLGIVTVAAVGIVMAFAGPGSTLQVTFLVLSLLTTLLVLVVGIWVARKAW